jgi:hypothetical protein
MVMPPALLEEEALRMAMEASPVVSPSSPWEQWLVQAPSYAPPLPTAYPLPSLAPWEQQPRMAMLPPTPSVHHLPMLTPVAMGDADVRGPDA